MERLTKELVGNILAGKECKSGLVCIGADIEELCKVMDIGMKSYMVCLEKDTKCAFAITPFTYDNNDNWWCTCPVRMHIAREYNKK